MRYFGKRALSMLCTLAMLLSLMAMIVPGVSAAETNEIDAIPSGHLISERVYSDFSSAPEEGTNYVDDAEAFGGKAVCYSKTALNDSSFVSIYRYDVASGLPDAELKIGSIENKVLKDSIGTGYQVYKFTYDVPAATTAGNVFYIMNNWQLNSSAFCADFAAYAGKTVEVYISMKATGPDGNGHYSLSVDRVALASVCEDYTVAGVCSKCGKTDALLSLIPSDHLVIVRDYTSFATSPGEGTTYVDDAEAVGGKAVCYSKTALNDSSFVSINRYDVASGLGDGHPSLKIGAISNEVLKASIGTGYQIYKFTYDVPAETTAGNVLYIMNNWQLNSSAFCADFAAYAGQTVEVYFSIKVSGPNGNGHYSIFVDRVALATPCKVVDGVCGVCGKTDPLLSQIPSEHLGNVRDYTYFASASAEGTNYVDDAEAFGGKAVCFSRLNLDGDTGMTFVTLHHYYGPDNGIGNLFKADLNVNQGYQIYKFTYEVPADVTDGGVVYLIPNWQLNSSQLSKDLYTYRGKTVDIYLSMKVTGPAADGYYSVSVDRVALATTCSYNENGVCSECGKRISYTFLADDFTLPYAPIDSVVEDSESSYGKAAKLSYADRVAANDAGLLNSMLRVSTETLDMKSYLANPETYVDIGSISIGRLNENSGKGYVTYTFRNVVPVPTNDNFFIYLFNCWGFQVKLTDAQIAQLAGRNVDISLSMKVEGNVSDSSNPPSYYIDKVTISGHMDETCEHGKTGVGLISDALHGTECYLCGEVLSTEEHTFDEGVENGDMITFTCSVCGYTRTAVIQKPVTGWNLTLDGNISVEFNLNVTDEEAASATVDVTVNGETTTENVADLEGYKLVVEVAAAQMNDSITVTLNKNGEKITKDYSVRAYADYILDAANGYNEPTKNLVKYMLAYGAASQTYFKYNDAEENLADKGIEVTPVAVPTEGGLYSVTGSAEGVKYYGSSLVYRNMIATRIYFSGDVTGKTFTVNGETVTPKAKGDLYYIEVADICPWDLDDGITVAVDGLTVVYAPMDYIIRMYAKGGESTDLVQALYGYYQAAEEYLLS